MRKEIHYPHARFTLVVSHSEFATFIEETDYDLVEAYKCMR